MTPPDPTVAPRRELQSGHGEKRTRKREHAIAALLTAPSLGEAARLAGIGEATLRRWLRDPAFAAAYRAARRQMLEPVVGHLQQAATAAVETLQRNLAASAESVQVRAAQVILERAFKGVELMDLAERVEALEARAAAAAASVQRGRPPW
jgi:hypothetical protein